MERYINNEFLSAIKRPQPYKLCAVVSIASIIKIMDGNSPTYDEICEATGISRNEAIQGRIGNNRMQMMASKFGINLGCYDKAIGLPDWETIKELLRSNNHPIIYHSKGHYCLLVGFVEEPMMLNSGDKIRLRRGDIQRWLVIADHRVKGKTGHKDGMFELVTWYDVKQTIRNNANCALLIVS